MNKPIHPAVAEHVMEENERLRGLLEELHPYVRGCSSELWDRYHAALSQQSEPTDTFTAVDMATAAARGFRDGQAAVEPSPAQDDLRSRCAEILDWQHTGVLTGDALRAFADSQPYAADCNRLQMAEADTARQAYRFVVRSGQVDTAPAQDEREAFEAWLPRPWSRDARLDDDGDLVYAEDWVQGAWIGWQAALATRPAQTEQQPYGWHWQAVFRGEVVNSGFEVGPCQPNLKAPVEGVTFEYQDVYAAPIAQTAQGASK